MRSILLFLFLACCAISAQAKHITGGEMIYDYVGPASANSKYYRITLRLFRDENCTGCADMPASVTIGVYNNDNNQRVGNFRTVDMSSSEVLPLNTLPSCITNPPTLNYRAGYYTFLIELPNNAQGYTASYQTCCRIDGIQNVGNSIGATYIAQIPGNNTLGAAGTDSSPRFSKGISVVCYLKPFTLDFSAQDPNAGDSLVYSLYAAFTGGSASDANFSQPAPPPYPAISYTNGYSGTRPLGLQASINPATGIISGIAPEAGRYVVSVCVATYRGGAIIAQHRKDFIISVAPCDFAGAQLQPGYLSCDGFTFNFDNLNTSPLNVSFLWDFGDGNSSTSPSPTHTYATAGIYTLKLFVNKGSSCSDSTTSELRVFPGYFPKFGNNSPMCKGLPVSFFDQTTANYGAANKWRWNFGDPAATNDTSILKNPTYTYNTSGTYYVELYVESDKGCTGTFRDTVIITDKPTFSITNDTLICSIDTLQLNAIAGSGAGTITWSPNYNISNVNSFTPRVWPKVTTTYSVTYSNNFGCSASDQVTVNVVDLVTLSAMPDTTICTTDQVILRADGNALKYTWSPPETLNDPSIKNPTATPLAMTTYNVKGTIGRCESNKQVVVKTVPYPVVTLSPDTTICFGETVPLTATGGSIYTWSPTNYLSASNIPNPISTPATSVTYTVSVKDVLGCPKPVTKTTKINVVKILADAGPQDTAIVLGQPLQLQATGSVFYNWDPPIWLNNAFISNPLAFPQDNIRYTVKVSDAAGCFGTDTINVKLYKIEPDLLVPSGFTPNSDGTNDVFRPIPIGMRAITAFKVYNRWGQLLFSTTDNGKGWDGKFGGNLQDPGTYVWYAEGIDYLNKKIQRKGYVVLIR